MKKETKTPYAHRHVLLNVAVHPTWDYGITWVNDEGIQCLFTMIPYDETVDEWTESIRSEADQRSDGGLSEFFHRNNQTILSASIDGEVRYEIIAQKSLSLLYEVYVTDDFVLKDRYFLVKILLDDERVYTLMYVHRRPESLGRKRSIWIERFKNSRIAPFTPDHVLMMPTQEQTEGIARFIDATENHHFIEQERGIRRVRNTAESLIHIVPPEDLYYEKGRMCELLAEGLMLADERPSLGEIDRAIGLYRKAIEHYSRKRTSSLSRDYTIVKLAEAYLRRFVATDDHSYCDLSRVIKVIDDVLRKVPKEGFHNLWGRAHLAIAHFSIRARQIGIDQKFDLSFFPPASRGLEQLGMGSISVASKAFPRELMQGPEVAVLLAHARHIEAFEGRSKTSHFALCLALVSFMAAQPMPRLGGIAEAATDLLQEPDPVRFGALSPLARISAAIVLGPSVFTLNDVLLFANEAASALNDELDAILAVIFELLMGHAYVTFSTTSHDDALAIQRYNRALSLVASIDKQVLLESQKAWRLNAGFLSSQADSAASALQNTRPARVQPPSVTCVNRTIGLLRSFDGPEIQIQSSLGEAYSVALESALDAALRPFIPVETVGGEADTKSSLRIYTQDWQELVHNTLKSDQLIFFIPGATKGLEWEARQIAEASIWSRVLCVMPPVDAKNHSAADWRTAKDTYADFGFLLPDYSDDGGVITFTPQGTVDEILPFSAIIDATLAHHLEDRLPLPDAWPVIEIVRDIGFNQQASVVEKPTKEDQRSTWLAVLRAEDGHLDLGECIALAADGTRHRLGPAQFVAFCTGGVPQYIARCTALVDERPAIEDVVVWSHDPSLPTTPHPSSSIRRRVLHLRNRRPIEQTKLTVPATPVRGYVLIPSDASGSPESIAAYLKEKEWGELKIWHCNMDPVDHRFPWE